MLTAKGKYGLKAMVYLARIEPGKPAPIAEIASRNNIPKKFLDAILGELRKAGLVQSKKGKGGGCALALPSSVIMVGQIVRALDGPLAPIRCASQNYYHPCDDCDETRCEVRAMMWEVREAITKILDNRSLHELSAQDYLVELPKRKRRAGAT